MRHASAITGVAILLVAAVTGCSTTKREAMETTNDSLVAANPQETTPADLTPQTDYQQAPSTPQSSRAPAPAPRRRSTSPRPSSEPVAQTSRGVTVPSGTAVSVSVNTQISSETAQVGDTWTGTVNEAIVIDGRTVIPAGSTVTGTVNAVTPASKGDRASLDLAMSSINVEGRTYRVHGGTEAIIAGSTRARNLGAIAAGTAAGAIVGKAVSGSGKGALIGGLIGAAATGGAVAKSKGYQVVLKEGTDLTFTTTESVAVRM